MASASSRVCQSGHAEGELLRVTRNNWLNYYCQLADYLADGQSALVINHGGVVELGAVACLPDADHTSWGSHFECCEGVRLFWEDGKFVTAEILRV